MIISQNCILVERFKEEREEYEQYVKHITKEKILIAKEKMNDNDLKVLKLVYQFKICTSDQIAKMVFKHSKSPTKLANNSIKKLFTLGCIDRFFPMINSGSSKTHVVLAPIGARIIEIKQFRRMLVLTQNWKHTVSANDVLAYLFSKYKLLDFKSEMKIEFKNTTIRPDLFVGWKDENKEKYAMFEIDLGTEHMVILNKKVKTYCEYFNSIGFKVDKWQPYENIAIMPTIIFIFNDKERARKLSNYIQKLETTVRFQVFTFDKLNI